MTDAISLIGMIYECARVKNIAAIDFESIVMRSYEKTMHLKNSSMPSSLEQLVSQTNKKTSQQKQLGTVAVPAQSAKVGEQFGFIPSSGNQNLNGNNANSSAMM